MKRLFCLLLVLCLMLSGCGKKTADVPATEAPTTAPTTKATEPATEATAPAPTDPSLQNLPHP